MAGGKEYAGRRRPEDSADGRTDVYRRQDAGDDHQPTGQGQPPGGKTDVLFHRSIPPKISK